MNNGKFTIRGGQLVFKKTGTPIPSNEPVFILRACDRQALSILRVYQSKMRPVSKEWKGIQSVIEDFIQFRQLNRLEMLDSAEAYKG
ncbi:hypothetical protein LCGC14_1173310 [marine sediment metagenome]|uniref:Uncharacterized protein n=1 Tax=marine sediment metagenome TaxID=412755 RepID=A0A0F9MC48_9ZZZZ